MNKLFQAFAQAADGVLIVNQDQDIIFYNQAAREILGYSHTEAVGQPCYKILAGRDNQGHPVCRSHCHVARAALRDGTVPNYDSCIRTKRGEIRWVNMSTFTLPANGADPVLVHLFRDVSKTKQIEQFFDQVLAAAQHLHRGDMAQAVPPAPAKQEYVELTGREREVLTLLAQGLSTADLAQTLSISLATVRNHIRNILQKLQVHSRLEAVVYAMEHGLLAGD